MSQRTHLEDIYGLQFPENLFLFWEFVQSYPSLFAVLEIGLTGPFDILRASQYSGKNPLYEARYYNDPPEFLTVATGNTDGLHWGYYIDDYHSPEFPVASYYSNDAFEITIDGGTLFEAIRSNLEAVYATNVDYMQDDPCYKQYYEEKISQLIGLRSALQAYETGERLEVGREYLTKYSKHNWQTWMNSSKRRVVASTRDGMGIVVSRETYCPLSGVDAFQIWNYEPTMQEIEAKVAEDMQFLSQGCPGTALKLGKDLWIYQNFRETSYALLDAAYAALDRELLRKWLDIAIAYRKDCDARDQLKFSN